MNYKQYVEFWDTPSVLEERPDSLEQQFEKLHTLEKDVSSAHVERSADARDAPHESNHRLDNVPQNPPQGHLISYPEQSIGSETSNLRQSSLSAFQHASEPTAEPTSLTTDSFLARNPFPTPPNSRTTFEESISFPYGDGNLNDLGFWLQAGGELDFPNFLNSLFSGSYDQI
jgi:hypothetical protein